MIMKWFPVDEIKGLRASYMTGMSPIMQWGDRCHTCRLAQLVLLRFDGQTQPKQLAKAQGSAKLEPGGGLGDLTR